MRSRKVRGPSTRAREYRFRIRGSSDANSATGRRGGRPHLAGAAFSGGCRLSACATSAEGFAYCFQLIEEGLGKGPAELNRRVPRNHAARSRNLAGELDRLRRRESRRTHAPGRPQVTQNLDLGAILLAIRDAAK